MKLERLSCSKRLERLCDYLDKELPPAARKAVAAHRRSCLPCADILASLKRTIRLLKTLRNGPQAPAAAGRERKAVLAERILSASRASNRRRKD
ncbi:MAG: hypothetical protein PHS14_06770 [Elusimicrobia bacterium]|nr:hypothetical protein [Elusimicrobiota bacterium]